MTKVKLAAMMFLEFFIWGGWYLTVSTWVSQTLHFSGVQTGWIVGSTAIGALVSPFLAGWVADNLMPAQYMLALLHLIGAVLLYLASNQTHYGPLYGIILTYAGAAKSVRLPPHQQPQDGIRTHPRAGDHWLDLCWLANQLLPRRRNIPA